MTQEEKNKRYDEALERAKKLQETCDSTAVVGWCEYIFPELKESADERIRKKVIEVLKLNIKGAESQMQASRGVDRCFEIYACNKVIAWLEKQGNMLDADKVIAWLECKAFQSWADPIDTRPIIRKFKKDFGL